MSVPGSNLFRRAASLIRLNSVNLRRFTGMVTRSDGLEVPSFAAAETVSVSAQPAQSTLIATLGLDMSKSYFMFYSSNGPFNTPERGRAGDLIQFAGEWYQVINATPWAFIDGWDSVLCVKTSAPA